jgi:transglutaminase-like putative cysteine protease
MPVFKIHHITKYEYDRFVQESVNEIRIFSYQDRSQEVVDHELSITGAPEILSYTDYWGNRTGVFNVLLPHKELVIDSRLIVSTKNSGELLINYLGDFTALREEVNGNLKLLELSRPDMIVSTDAIAAIIDSIDDHTSSIAEIVQRCCNNIFNRFQYIKGITNIETTVDELLEKQVGVCQDFAHVMLQVLRTLNIPSRYVSGYICPNKDGLRGVGATHAWVEAWLPAHGWAGIDPTNNVWVTNSHVKLAVGRNFNDCTPAKGSFKGPARQNLSVYVSVGYEDGHVFEGINDVALKGVERFSAQKMAQEAAQQ